MKKLIFAALILTGCTPQSEKIITKVHGVLKETMKDPDSYKAVSGQITDTIDADRYFSIYLESKPSLNPLVESMRQTHEKMYIIDLRYRAKNGYGAYDGTKSETAYYLPDRDSIVLKD